MSPRRSPSRDEPHTHHDWESHLLLLEPPSPPPSSPPYSPLYVPYSPTSPKCLLEPPCQTNEFWSTSSVYLPEMLQRIPSPMQVYSPTSPAYFPELLPSSESSQESPKSPQYRPRTPYPTYTDKSVVCNQTQMWSPPNTHMYSPMPTNYPPESQNLEPEGVASSYNPIGSNPDVSSLNDHHSPPIETSGRED